MDEPTVFQQHRTEDIKWNGFIGQVQYPSGNKYPIFYSRPMHNPQKSLAVGKPVYDAHDYVKIMTPGERLEIPDRPVRDEDKQRWGMQWMQYQKNQEQVPDGTPVDLLFPTHPEIPATLRGNGIHTIEQLADLSAHGVESMMGGQMWKNQAVAYLEKANKGVDFHQFQKEREEKDSKIRVLNQTVEMLKGEVMRMQAVINNTVMGMSNQQAMMSGARPQFPQQAMPTQMGQIPLSQTFDSQTAQINATNAMTRHAQDEAQPSRLTAVSPPVIAVQKMADITQVLPETPYAQPPVQAMKRRGRPPGARNKPKDMTV